MRPIRRQQIARRVQRLPETGNIAVAEYGPHTREIAYFARAPRHVLVRQIPNRRLRRGASYGLHLCRAPCHALARLENFADIASHAALSLRNPANQTPSTS